MQSETKQYDEDVVNQLIDMGVATRDEIMFASKQTVNYKNINDVLDVMNRIKDDHFYQYQINKPVNVCCHN